MVEKQKYVQKAQEDEMTQKKETNKVRLEKCIFFFKSSNLTGSFILAGFLVWLDMADRVKCEGLRVAIPLLEYPILPHPPATREQKEQVSKGEILDTCNLWDIWSEWLGDRA